MANTRNATRLHPPNALVSFFSYRSPAATRAISISRPFNCTAPCIFRTYRFWLHPPFPGERWRLTTISLSFSNAITSAPAPSDATCAVVRASANGSKRLKLILNRAATFPRVSLRSPPVTCTSRVCGGSPCRKK